MGAGGKRGSSIERGARHAREKVESSRIRGGYRHRRSGDGSAAPDELFVAARYVAVPPEPPVFMFHVLYAGDPEAGKSAVRPLRSHGRPLADTIEAMSYLAAQRLEPPPPPGPNVVRTGYFRSLSHEMLDALSEACSKGPPDHLAQLVPLNGASSRVPTSETAFGLRDPGYSVLLNSG